MTVWPRKSKTNSPGLELYTEWKLNAPAACDTLMYKNCTDFYSVTRTIAARCLRFKTWYKRVEHETVVQYLRGEIA